MKRILRAVLISLIPLFLLSPLALAAAPPGVMQIYSVQVVRNTIIDGDTTFVFHGYIEDYSYTEPASDTILMRLYDTDNVTLLSATVPYVYFGYGYDNFVASFYFDNTTAISWNGAYIINITGTPGSFDTLPTPVNRSLETSDFCSGDSQSSNQVALAGYVLSVAQLLELAYPAYSFYGSTGDATVLSDVGETYFKGCIPGLQSMAPELFLVQFYIPVSSEMLLGSNQSVTYGARLEDTEIAEGMAELGAEMGLDWQSVAGGFAFILALCSIGFTQVKWGRVEPGLMAAGLVLSAAALLLGEALMALRLFLALLAGMIVMYFLFFKRS